MTRQLVKWSSGVVVDDPKVVPSTGMFAGLEVDPVTWIPFELRVDPLRATVGLGPDMAADAAVCLGPDPATDVGLGPDPATDATDGLRPDPATDAAVVLGLDPNINAAVVPNHIP